MNSCQSNKKNIKRTLFLGCMIEIKKNKKKTKKVRFR